MKTFNCEQRSPEWKKLRMGKVTGTGLKKIVGTPKAKKNYLYEILAERIVEFVISDGEENEEKAMERGVRLEPEGIAEFEKQTGKKVEQVGFAVSDKNKYIANSPDGFIKVKGKYSEALEIKCPNASTHLKYWLENVIPDEYLPQLIQYFIVNEELKSLYFASYDPRITMHPIHILKLERKDIEEEIKNYTELQIEFLKEVDLLYKKITK